jgi:hypothetical protein
MATEKTTVRAKTPVLYTRLTPYWCDTCMQLVTMISVEEATMLCRMSAEVIYRNMENRQFHSIQASTGTHFICLRSLTAKI